MLERFRMDGRVAIVTGGSGGLGSAAAAALAEAGGDVVLAARGPEGLARAAGRIAALGRRAVTVAVDLTDLSALPALVAAAVDTFGHVDTLVNIVGGAGPSPLMDTTSAMLEESFHLNVTVAYELTRLVVPHLLAAGGGAVVNTSSALGHLRERGFTSYATAKAALEHVTRQLAADLAPRIRVNAIAPGAILTEPLRQLLTPDTQATMVGLTPLHRLGTPEDIALAVLYLVSDAGSYITGKILQVDGGQEAANLPLGYPDLHPPIR
jgi:7-alpha-hydroxysteroid dehydrogenase